MNIFIVPLFSFEFEAIHSVDKTYDNMSIENINTNKSKNPNAYFVLHQRVAVGL